MHGGAGAGGSVRLAAGVLGDTGLTLPELGKGPGSASVAWEIELLELKREPRVVLAAPGSVQWERSIFIYNN